MLLDTWLLFFLASALWEVYRWLPIKKSNIDAPLSIMLVEVKLVCVVIQHRIEHNRLHITKLTPLHVHHWLHIGASTQAWY